MEIISGGPSVVNGTSSWWDKVPSKFQNWGSQDFQDAGFRAVPNCVVRRSAFIARSCLNCHGIGTVPRGTEKCL